MKKRQVTFRILAALLAACFFSTASLAADATAKDSKPAAQEPKKDAPAAAPDPKSDKGKADKKDATAKGDEKSENAEEEAKPPVVPLGESLGESAKAEYNAGKLLYRDGDYAAALIKFQRAYEQSHDGRLLWNMAVCQKQLRHYVELLRLVERYKHDAADKMSEQDKQQAAALIGAVKQFVSNVSLDVNVKGATVFVDGKQMDVSPLTKPIAVNMGERTIEVKKKGYLPYKRVLQVAGNTQLQVAVELKEDKNEGKLQVIAKKGQTIWIDGKAVGSGTWQGTVSSGGHTVRVSAKGMRTYQNEIDVPKHGSKNLHIVLDKEVVVDNSSNAWIWITGSAVVLAGAGVGAYFLFRPQETEQAPPLVEGTISPGTIPLP